MHAFAAPKPRGDLLCLMQMLLTEYLTPESWLPRDNRRIRTLGGGSRANRVRVTTLSYLRAGKPSLIAIGNVGMELLYAACWVKDWARRLDKLRRINALKLVKPRHVVRSGTKVAFDR